MYGRAGHSHSLQRGAGKLSKISKFFELSPEGRSAEMAKFVSECNKRGRSLNASKSVMHVSQDLAGLDPMCGRDELCQSYEDRGNDKQV